LDARRLRYLHTSLSVQTVALEDSKQQLAFTIRQNRLTRHDKNFLGISGDPYTGKSHLLFSLARATAAQMARDIPDWIERGYVPCVIITVPSPINTKGILRELAAFFDFPYDVRLTEDQLRRMLVDVMRTRRTLVLAFDEAQNMTLQGARTLEDSKNLLRKLSQELRVTQIYAGTELRTTGLLDGVSGHQLSERIRLIELRPFAVQNADAREIWRETIDAFETGLCLVGHPSGSLRELDEYLLYASDGMMGQLASLLRNAAVSLIEERSVERFGQERLTVEAIKSLVRSEATRQREQGRQ
jgi:hypothetical protein